MAVSRIRKTQSQREHDSIVDDFVTQGHEVIEQGERTTLLRKKSWGSFLGHTIVFLLTVWWTLGLGNLAYAVIAHYTAEKIMVRIEEQEQSATSASRSGGRDLEAV